MKIKKMKIINIVLTVVSIILILFTPFSFMKKSLGISRYDKEALSAFLEIWNIDIFEGGKGSRTDFLYKRGLAFNKSYNKVFINVETLTLVQAKENLKNGIFPDMISFSGGANFLEHLKEYNGTINIREEIINSGKKDEKVFAVGWCMGGYTLIKRQTATDYYVSGTNGINAPLAGLYFGATKDDIALKTIVKERMNFSQYEAYEHFISNEKAVLIGTQRDLERINTRVNNGRISSAEFSMLNGYTDLVQYIAITKYTSNEEYEAAKLFVSYLTSEKVQQQLIGISMYNVLGINIYGSEPYSEMERALNQKLKIPNSFVDCENINDIAFEALKGNEEAIKNLNEMIS